MQEKVQKTGSILLFFLQIFSTLSFSILYSTLVLYMTKSLKLSNVDATAITASFVAFNYALHLLGGFITGRFFSHRSLFAIGMFLQAFGCFLLSRNQLNFGLAFFLSGSGLNVTCINCMLTSFYSSNDKKREKAFLWNYSGMNIGFLIGFTISGFFEKLENYKILFSIGASSNLLTLLIVLSFFRILKDRETYFSDLIKIKKNLFRLLGISLIISLIFSLKWLLKNSSFSNKMILIAGILMGIMILYYAIKQKDKLTKEKIFAFFILCIMSILFWTLYQTAPMGLTLFLENNVNRNFLGIEIQPQWVMNINSVIIIAGGPIMAYIYKIIRKKRFLITIPTQFTLSLLLIGLAFILLGISTNFANSKGFININWIIISYILQSLAELFIGPIGYAMIGQLIPQRLQGIMMGSWMMLTGIAAVFSNIFSKMAISSTTSIDPLVTNIYFSKTFNFLGIITIAAGIIMLLLVRFLNKLIKEVKHPSEPPSIPV